MTETGSQYGVEHDPMEALAPLPDYSCPELDMILKSLRNSVKTIDEGYCNAVCRRPWTLDPRGAYDTYAVEIEFWFYDEDPGRVGSLEWHVDALNQQAHLELDVDVLRGEVMKLRKKHPRWERQIAKEMGYF